MCNVAIVTDFDAKNDINPNDYSNPLQQKKFLLIENDVSKIEWLDAGSKIDG